jgi:hypothetical protein
MTPTDGRSPDAREDSRQAALGVVVADVRCDRPSEHECLAFDDHQGGAAKLSDAEPVG